MNQEIREKNLFSLKGKFKLLHSAGRFCQGRDFICKTYLDIIEIITERLSKNPSHKEQRSKGMK
jgi:hypothetical protein